MKIAIGIPSGERKKLINSMFKVIGKIKILAKVTNLPETKDSPQSNSILLARGIKYVEAISPS
jgi:hypothetical protein